MPCYPILSSILLFVTSRSLFFLFLKNVLISFFPQLFLLLLYFLTCPRCSSRHPKNLVPPPLFLPIFTCPINFITFHIFKHTYKYLSTIRPPHYNYFLPDTSRHVHWLLFHSLLLILNRCYSTYYPPLYLPFIFLFFFPSPVLAAAPDILLFFTPGSVF